MEIKGDDDKKVLLHSFFIVLDKYFGTHVKQSCWSWCFDGSDMIRDQLAGIGNIVTHCNFE